MCNGIVLTHTDARALSLFLCSLHSKLSTLSGDVRKSVSDALCRSTRAMVDLTKRTLESRSSSGSSSQPSSDDAVLQTHNKTLKAHCAAYKIYGFFLHWLVLEQEKLATDQSAAPVAAAAATKGGVCASLSRARSPVVITYSRTGRTRRT